MGGLRKGKTAGTEKGCVTACGEVLGRDYTIDGAE